MDNRVNTEDRHSNALSVYSSMTEGEPYKIYRKTILGKVEVKVLDPFDETKVIYVLLTGNPDASNGKSLVELWTPMQHIFFLRNNEAFLENGTVIEEKVARKKPEIKQTVNNLSDAELEDIVKNYKKLASALEDMTSINAVSRTLHMANKMERPVKTIELIEKKLSFMQAQEYVPEE